MKPQPFSVGVFSCLIAWVPACCRGFLRKPADLASRPTWPFTATFHSLLAIPRSDLATWNWPEVRKGRDAGPYRSKGYARTNQAVGLQHWLPEWANVPSAKPTVLPCVLFDLFKQFLRSEPGSGVLRRSKRFKIYPITTCDIDWTTDVIVVARVVQAFPGVMPGDAGIGIDTKQPRRVVAAA